LRGRGFGEVLLAGMIQKAISMHAAYVVLEVRVSNVTAQSLYRKYEFDTIDLKKGYYHNNGEDAYDMRLNLEDTAIRARLESRFATLRQRSPFADAYTQTPRVR
jgi:ribosomal protein S18 acetylase RimI-like enzyme